MEITFTENAYGNVREVIKNLVALSEALPTLHQGHFSDLIVDTPFLRLHRVRTGETHELEIELEVGDGRDNWASLTFFGRRDESNPEDKTIWSGGVD